MGAQKEKRRVLTAALLIALCAASTCDAAATQDATLLGRTFGESHPNQAVPGAGKPGLVVLNHTSSTGGCVTHVWATGGGGTGGDVRFSFFVDGEAEPSVSYVMTLASASPSDATVGFSDNAAPWGTKHFGHGSSAGGWFNNIRIPFGKSIVAKANSVATSGASFFMILRGQEGARVTVGDVLLPPSARLRLVTLEEQRIGAFDLIPIVNVSEGSGLIFMSSLFIKSGSECFLEGCFHLMVGGEPFPGTTLSTGGEDYWNSAYYFAAGGGNSPGANFALPTVGLTHLNSTKPYNSDGPTQFSAYRIHEQDPLVFRNGVQFVMRNGEVEGNPKAPDPDCTSPKCSRNYKCFNLQKPPQAEGICTWGGHRPAPDPRGYNVTESIVTSYAWVYFWDDEEAAAATRRDGYSA